MSADDERDDFSLDTIETANTRTYKGRIRIMLGSDRDCRILLRDEREGDMFLITDSHRLQTLVETAFAQQIRVTVIYEENVEFPKRLEQIKLMRDEP